MDVPITIEKEPKNMRKAMIIALIVFVFLFGFGFYQLSKDVKKEMRQAESKYSELQNYVAGRLFLSYKDDKGEVKIAPLSGVASVKQEFELSKEEKEIVCK